MPVLNQYQSSELLHRLPHFELSYETVSHKKVSDQYDITLAIPYGKKAYMWFTFYQDKDVCLLLEMTKEKKIGNVSVLFDSHVPCKLAYNTLLYGSLCEIANQTSPFFLVEELLYYMGIPLFKQPFHERLSFLELFFQSYQSTLQTYCPVGVTLPMMWTFNENLPLSWQDTIPYQVHHLQHRCLEKIVPYMNEPMTKNILNQKSIPEGGVDLFLPPPLPRFDFSKQQYTQPCCFEVKADLQNDVYHLYAFGRNSERVYCGLAYLPSYTSSVFMNSLFRNIKENRNLDALEESDDEEDFQDTRPDKYVSLEKMIVMECVFQRKFRKWKPVRAIYRKEQGKVVHISRL